MLTPEQPAFNRQVQSCSATQQKALGTRVVPKSGDHDQAAVDIRPDSSAEPALT